MDASRSVRHTARACGISPSTAFRWRHRLLSRSTQIRAEEVRQGGWIITRLVPLPESPKGDPSRGPIGSVPVRGLTASPRRGSPNHIWTLATIVRTGPTRAASLHLDPLWIAPMPPPAGALVRGLSPLVRTGARAFGEFGSLSPMASACRSLRVRWNALPQGTRRLGHLDDDIRTLRRHGVQLRYWIRPFRGVATHHLGKYLTWYLLVHRHAALPVRVAHILGISLRRRNAVPGGTRLLEAFLPKCVADLETRQHAPRTEPRSRGVDVDARPCGISGARARTT
jgi:hypothetical protein